MNYTPQYSRFLVKGNRISKSRIQPYGIYKISIYKYVDEGKKSLRGSDETLIFVTGIFNGKVSALKLSNIPPNEFLNWFKGVTNDVYDTDKLTNTTAKIGLYDIETPMDVGGSKIYNLYINDNRKFVAKGAAYRTYNLSGIQYTSELFLKNNIIQQYYG